MYNNKKYGIVGIVLAIIILIILFTLTNMQNNKLSYIENINSLVSVSEDCLIYVWSLDNISFNPSSENVEPYLHLRGHTGPLFCVEHGKDNLIYTGVLICRKM